MNTATSIIVGPWIGYLNQGLALRELQCVLGIACGKTSKELARDFGVQPDTVKKRVLSASTKLGVLRRAQLVAEAMKRGLITPVAIGLVVLVAAHSVLGDDQGIRNRRVGERRMEQRTAGRRLDDIQLAA